MDDRRHRSEPLGLLRKSEIQADFSIAYLGTHDARRRFIMFTKARSLTALPLSISLCLGLVTLTAMTGGCTTADTSEETAEANSELTERDWSRSVQYLSTLTYIPWGFTEDGCYARALYYSMNLAAEGIASNHVYIVAQPGYGLGRTGAWWYHVAPLVSRDATGELLVLDPIYDAQSPIRLDNWTVRQSRYAPGSEHAPAIHVMPGNSYGQAGAGPVVADVYHPDVASFREPASFSSMPAFSIDAINSACHVMQSYIDKEGSGSAAQKHSTLSRETRRLVTALASRGKLAGDASALDASCLSYAPEIAGCPADDGVTNPGSRDCCLASAHFCWSDANQQCNAPGAVLNGRTCGAGGNWATGSATPPNGGTGNPSNGACPADNASTNPGSKECCLASRYWCWSSSAQFCANPGYSHVVSGVQWTCGANGEWTQ